MTCACWFKDIIIFQNISYLKLNKYLPSASHYFSAIETVETCNIKFSVDLS